MDTYKCKKCEERFLSCDLVRTKCSENECGANMLTFCPKCFGKIEKEQEAKTGHWVSVNDGDTVAIDNDGCPERACYCSECQKYLIASDEYAVYGRYCPFCGAKMEGW